MLEKSQKTGISKFKHKLHHLLTSKEQSFFVQFIRCSFAGGLAFVVDFSVFAFLTEVCHLYYIISNSISFTFGVLVNYFISISWIFPDSKFNSRKVEFVTFAVIGIIGLALTNLLLWGFSHFLGFHHLLSKALAAGIAYIWNFLIKKYWLFNSK